MKKAQEEAYAEVFNEIDKRLPFMIPEKGFEHSPHYTDISKLILFNGTFNMNAYQAAKRQYKYPRNKLHGITAAAGKI